MISTLKTFINILLVERDVALPDISGSAFSKVDFQRASGTGACVTGYLNAANALDYSISHITKQAESEAYLY